MGHDTAKYMFVDSKLGVHDRDRLMVTREPSGTLRHMTEEERERLNQIYFPKPGRRIKPPVLFEIENLEKVHILTCGPKENSKYNPRPKNVKWNESISRKFFPY